MKSEPTVDRVEVAAYTVPTDSPEADGTYSWNETTLVVVQAFGGGQCGLGYTYADIATAHLIEEHLAPSVQGRGAFDVPAAWNAMVRRIRNLGRPGVCSMAVAAVDSALWDLKAHLLELPLVKLWGCARETVETYGSGGFTSYTIEQLRKQLRGWAEEGLRAVKMKVGSQPGDDAERVSAARDAIGDDVLLFVDANGAYQRKQALRQAELFAEIGVAWFEEPVSSDDLEGLRLLRDRAPASMDIAAGEYAYDLPGFRRLIESGAVDVLQADATRCAGPSEFLRAGALAAAHSLRLSAHTAPSAHVHLMCALQAAWNIEYFYDHVRIERMLFDGAAVVSDGVLAPDLSRPGLGIEFKRRDAEKFKVYQGGSN